MLNHHARRLTVRLMILFVMVAALLWLSPNLVGRKAQASGPAGCFVTFDPETGQCVYLCCDASYCTASEC